GGGSPPRTFPKLLVGLEARRYPSAIRQPPPHRTARADESAAAPEPATCRLTPRTNRQVATAPELLLGTRGVPSRRSRCVRHAHRAFGAGGRSGPVEADSF